MAFRSVTTGLALCLAASTLPSAASDRAVAVREADLAVADAHARMPDTMYASTPSEQKPYFAHPSPTAKPASADSGTAAPNWPKNSSADDDTAESVFRRHISSPVVQAKCVGCHVRDGQSSHTRLVFTTSAAEGHVTHNYRVFEDFVLAVHDAPALILDKIRGVAHGGGQQVPGGSSQYAHMRRFLQLLDDETAPTITPENLFETVRMRAARKTFYQAALIFAGRVPTEAELGPWANPTEFRAALRGLMEGPKFHEFLLRGANDRLLTDACCFSLRSTHFVDYINELHRLRAEGKPPEQFQFVRDVVYGAKRAPLELIAHVAENDLPYTEILTADYIMANPPAATAYGGKPSFRNIDDVHEFQPTRIERYYRRGDDHETDYDGSHGTRVTNPGSLATDFPHAGVLNTPGLLYRYPTTPTNRNRARARWTYLHFLGVDIENLGTRAIDPAALADSDNPTMRNPACTGCHALGGSRWPAPFRTTTSSACTEAVARRQGLAALVRTSGKRYFDIDRRRRNDWKLVGHGVDNRFVSHPAEPSPFAAIRCAPAHVGRVRSRA